MNYEVTVEYVVLIEGAEDAQQAEAMAVRVLQNRWAFRKAMGITVSEAVHGDMTVTSCT